MGHHESIEGVMRMAWFLADLVIEGESELNDEV